jgi:deoxyadenosine/deoxycytidine kinase
VKISVGSGTGKKKPRFSQIFNFEQDFKVVLEKEEEKKALEMFSQKRENFSFPFLSFFLFLGC